MCWGSMWNVSVRLFQEERYLIMYVKILNILRRSSIHWTSLLQLYNTVSLFLYMKALHNPKMYQHYSRNTFDTLKINSILVLKSRGYSGAETIPVEYGTSCDRVCYLSVWIFLQFSTKITTLVLTEWDKTYYLKKVMRSIKCYVDSHIKCVWKMG